MPLNDFIEIGFFDGEGNLIDVKMVHVSEIENQLSFSFDEEIGRIEVDPNYLLIDVERGDDIYEKGFLKD